MLEGTHDIHWPRSIATVASRSRKVSAATGHGALLHTAIAAGTAAGAEAEKVALLLEMDSLQAQIAARSSECAATGHLTTLTCPNLP